MVAPFDAGCPSCGHSFTLANLKRMAVGDGWQRYLWVELPNGKHAFVSFDQFVPATMRPIDAPEAHAILGEYIDA